MYAIWSIEKSPKTGILHVQGYVRFRIAVDWSRPAKKFKPGHVEECVGSEAQNVDYCTKSETHILGPFEFGARAEPGKRKDIELVREMIGEGLGMREMCARVTGFQGIKTAEAILKYSERRRDWVPEVWWFHGTTAGGKTREAVAKYPNAWMSMKNASKSGSSQTRRTISATRFD